MKKSTLFIIFCFISTIILAQDLPTEPANGFSFPLGSKFTIKLYPIDSVNFNYSIIEYEPFEEFIDTWENDTLFIEKEKDGTIEFYFCLATHGDSENEREENMKIVLLMKNRSEYALKYSSEIQIEEDGDFQKTSNVGMFPGANSFDCFPGYSIMRGAVSEGRRAKGQGPNGKGQGNLFLFFIFALNLDPFFILLLHKSIIFVASKIGTH
ncbi:MAG TPA: hypothetical protein PLI77_09425 [Bacteroidales bacterium]|nr:hypothetical protein [Bacteroidales bacterium]